MIITDPLGLPPLFHLRLVVARRVKVYKRVIDIEEEPVVRPLAGPGIGLVAAD
jgi:hypothetical protein